MTWMAALVLAVLLPAASPGADASAPFTASLSFTSGISLLTVDLDAAPENLPGAAQSGTEARVFRGAIPFGRGAAGAMEFLADLDRGLLFLDLNRNRRFDDDGPAASARTNRENYIMFEGLRVDAQSGGAVLRYEFDLWCYDAPYARFWRVGIRSGWQGAARIGGRTWALGIADDLDGEVDGDDLFIVGSSASPEPVVAKAPAAGTDGCDSGFSDRMAPSTNISLNGESFSLQFAWRGKGASSVLDVKFVPAALPAGTLEIESSLLKRLVLDGGGETVVLEPVPAAVPVPAGFYDSVTAYLAPAGKPALYISYLKPVRVMAGATRRIRVGGRLDNTIRISERGDFLRFEYDLCDAAGNSWQAVAKRADNVPKFSVRKDGKEVASGSFEYG